MEIVNKQESLATPVASKPMSLDQLGHLGILYQRLRDVITHSWKIELMHFVDGRPTVCVTVLAPTDDVFCYDEDIIPLLEDDPVPGYEFDGTSHACQTNVDVRDRAYYLCPVKR